MTKCHPSHKGPIWEYSIRVAVDLHLTLIWLLRSYFNWKKRFNKVHLSIFCCMALWFSWETRLNPGGGDAALSLWVADGGVFEETVAHWVTSVSVALAICSAIWCLKMKAQVTITKTTTVTPVCIQTVLLQTRFYVMYTIKNLKTLISFPVGCWELW